MIRKIIKSIFCSSCRGQVEEIDTDENRDIFFANISHEIRTPVNGIAGFTQLLKDTNLTEEQDELVNTIHTSSMHLLDLVNDILDFSKISANKLELEKISFDIFRQIEDTIETHVMLASEKDVELGLYIDPMIPVVLLGDPTKLSQIMINIVGNAIKFTDSFGTVDIDIIKVSESSNSVELKFSISDSGIGIGDEEKSKIFNQYAQANSSIEKKFGGTGLGLAISSKIVSLMGGNIRVNSELGKGSEFYFTIMLEKDLSSTSRSYENDFSSLCTGLLLPHKNVIRKVDSNLEKYIAYLGAKFEVYYEDEIFNIERDLLPDLLFVDQRYTRRDNEIEKILALDTKIILMTTSSIRKVYQFDVSLVSKILFKPMNLTKIIKSLKQSNEYCNTKETADEDFRGMRILVAEDNPVNQKLMKRILNNASIDVVIADNGERALSLHEEQDFDLIFMDIQMPVMGGLEAAKKIIEFETDNNSILTPIIALTGNIEQEDNQECLDAGMSDFMTKPIDIKQIINCIKEYASIKDRTIIEVNEIKKSFIYKGGKALIIEENQINQKLIERVLAGMGVESSVASNGSIGYAMYQEVEFDIVFVGTEMPVMSGMEVIAKIKEYNEIEFLDHVPIIVLLNESVSSGKRALFKDMNIDNYINKPLSIDEIKFQIERYLKDKKIEVQAIASDHTLNNVAFGTMENIEIKSDNYVPVVAEVEIEDDGSGEKIETLDTENDLSDNLEQKVPEVKSEYEIKYIDIPLG